MRSYSGARPSARKRADEFWPEVLEISESRGGDGGARLFWSQGGVFALGTECINLDYGVYVQRATSEPAHTHASSDIKKQERRNTRLFLCAALSAPLEFITQNSRANNRHTAAPPLIL